MRFIVLLLLSANFACGQGTHPITGRPIAPVMSVDGAPWLDREERAREEHPEAALAALHLKPGMTVADIGAGTGFYAFQFAQAVSPSGKVFATDIQEGMLAAMRSRAKQSGVRNIEIVRGSESDCKLPPNSIDIAFLADVYHELSQPQAMLRSIRRALKPDGRLVLLEFRKEDPAVPIRPEHEMTVATVKAEVLPEGFAFDRVVESMPWQHILFFKPLQQ